MKFDPAESAIILEQARQYTDSQRLGYPEIKTVVNDGTLPGIDIFGEGILFARASAAPIDLTTVIDITFTVDTSTVCFPFRDLIITELDVLQQAFIVDSENLNNLLVLTLHEEADGFPKGTYIQVVEGTGQIRYKGIHPIPQEYIPPLDYLTLNASDGTQYKIYVDETGTLQTVAL